MTTVNSSEIYKYYDNCECKYCKKSRGSNNKNFIIEVRYIGSVTDKALFGLFKNLRQWHQWKRYYTKKDRDKALEALQKKSNKPPSWEYRGVDL
jgi:hypothetical protein